MPENIHMHFLIRKLEEGPFAGKYAAFASDPDAPPGYGDTALRALFNLIRYMVETKENVDSGSLLFRDDSYD